MPRKTIDLVLSGAGTLLPCQIGAWAALLDMGYTVRRVVGTSAGGIVAAGIAHGWEPENALHLAQKLLDGRLQDWGWPFGAGFGAHRWRTFKALARESVPGSMAGGNVPWGVVTLDLEIRAPILLSNWGVFQIIDVDGRIVLHPEPGDPAKIPCADALAATSAIPGVVKVQKVAGVRGTFVDGGATMNFALGVFDDDENVPTVGIRFRSRPHARKAIDSVLAWSQALAGAILDSSNRTHLGAKGNVLVVDIDTDGEALAFRQSQAQVLKLYHDGYASTLRELGNVQ